MAYLLWQEPRLGYPASSLPSMVLTMLRSERCWNAVASFFKHILLIKEAAELERERRNLLPIHRTECRRVRDDLEPLSLIIIVLFFNYDGARACVPVHAFYCSSQRWDFFAEACVDGGLKPLTRSPMRIVCESDSRLRLSRYIYIWDTVVILVGKLPAPYFWSGRSPTSPLRCGFYPT